MEKIIKSPTFETIKNSAKIVGLAQYYIRQLVRRNKVKYIRAGTKYLLNIDNLIDYLNKGDNPQSTENSCTKINERTVQND